MAHPTSQLPVVVGVDGSSDARLAVDWAIGLARSDGPRAIHLIEAVSLPAIPDASWQQPVARLVEAAEAEARSRLEALAAELGAAGVEAHVHVRRFLAAEAILALAADVEAALLVLGGRGSGVRRALLGSVSGEVSRGAKVPVAVVRGRAASPPTRVLLALDGSAASRAAAAAAARWCPAAELLAATVEHDSDRLSAEEVEGELAAIGLAARARQRLRLAGSPAAELLAAASDQAVDLICAGRRGRGPLAELLVGSVAEKLLQLSPCPLLLAH